MSRRNRSGQQDTRFEVDAQKQYERCMVDTAEIIEYKKRPDLTLDEVAELRCKPYACRVQICMSMPGPQMSMHRDVYTGERFVVENSCSDAQTTFFNCVSLERAKILESLKDA